MGIHRKTLSENRPDVGEVDKENVMTYFRFIPRTDAERQSVYRNALFASNSYLNDNDLLYHLLFSYLFESLWNVDPDGCGRKGFSFLYDVSKRYEDGKTAGIYGKENFCSWLEHAPDFKYAPNPYNDVLEYVKGCTPRRIGRYDVSYVFFKNHPSVELLDDEVRMTAFDLHQCLRESAGVIPGKGYDVPQVVYSGCLSRIHDVVPEEMRFNKVVYYPGMETSPVSLDTVLLDGRFKEGGCSYPGEMFKVRSSQLVDLYDGKVVGRESMSVKSQLKR